MNATPNAKLPPVRRFEPGASIVADSAFLRARNIKASYRGSGTFYVQRPDGTYRTMTQAAYVAFVDAERVKAGLQPIRLPMTPAAPSTPKKRGRPPKARLHV
jgi:pyridoxal biosynthesis lyase PdxS